MNKASRAKRAEQLAARTACVLLLIFAHASINGARAGETLAALDPELAAEIVEELEDDDAADILGELPVADQERRPQFASTLPPARFSQTLLGSSIDSSGQILSPLVAM